MGPETFYKEARKVRIFDAQTEINIFHTSIYFNISNFKLFNTKFGREAGDGLLRKTAALLRTYFPTALITRLNADNFAMLSMKNDPKEAIECVSYQLKSYIGDPSIVLKAGIVYPTREITTSSMSNISHFTDLAHLACESIRTDAGHTWAVYEHSMSDRVNKRNFVISNFDMAFQRTKTEKSRALLSSIVALGKNLGLHTLAEGVETKEQADFLTSIGCEKIQGYYYGKPMDKETFLSHCRDRAIADWE